LLLSVVGCLPLAENGVEGTVGDPGEQICLIFGENAEALLLYESSTQTQRTAEFPLQGSNNKTKTDPEHLVSSCTAAGSN
jgi:hypothetical protein